MDDYQTASAILNGGCGLADHVDDDVGLGEHRHMAARHLGHGRAHALRDPALQIGVHGVVLRRQHIPARLGPPGHLIGRELLLKLIKRTIMARISPLRCISEEPSKSIAARVEITWKCTGLVIAQRKKPIPIARYCMPSIQLVIADYISLDGDFRSM